jgi:hypothetical protein
MLPMKRLGVALLVVAASAIALVTTGGGVVAKPKLPAERSIVGFEFLGEVSLPTGASFEGTEVGGLSSIVYDDKRGNYYAISDDPGIIDPVRYYTLRIDVADGRLGEGDIEIIDVTTVLDGSGAPFQPNSLDPEGIAMGHSGQLFVSSEGITVATPPVDPFIRRYNLNGRETAEVPVDDKFLPDGSGTFGVRQNLGFESLAVTPDDKRLFTATEAALAQDGPAADVGQTSLARMIEYDVGKRRALAEFVYVTDPVAEPPDPPDAFRVNGLVELLPIDNAGTQLAMERSFSVGAGNTVKLYEARAQGATDVSGFNDLFDENTGTTVPFQPVDKRFLLDFGDFVVPDNLEGLAFGPDLPDRRKLLIVVSDNNFAPSQVTQFIALAVSLD